jgi:tRNA-specific 2-thiouridylase
MTTAVAVSGGMDSLLALALLKEAGREVLALHAHFLPPDERQRELARALNAQCDALCVRFAAVDLSAAFSRLVIEPFVAAYAAGLTPNPCAGCNRDMKFGLLAREAARLGADRIATGHYARLPGEFAAAREDSGPGGVLPCPAQATAPDDSITCSPSAAGLMRGADPAKDQSYFLSLVAPEALSRAVFPLGGWLKKDVPAALAARGLAPPMERESQEVCFIPGDEYRLFLEARGAALPGEGPIQLIDGREIGRHKGLWRHTIGQRKGIGVAWTEPLYVLEKRAAGNALVVGPKSGLDVLECRVRDVCLHIEPDGWPLSLLAQTCYRQRPRPVRVTFTRGGLVLRFDAPIARPAEGQVAALYSRDGRVLAGGIIA